VSAEETAALVKTIYGLWNDRDLDAALDMATDDVDIKLMASGQTFTGRDGFGRFMERFANAFPDMKKEVTNEVASGHQVVFEVKQRGTHEGPLRTPTGEIPPTGKSVDLSVIEVASVRNGKLASLRNYSDTQTLMRQLGLSD
jgi:steroid delta-isomerase-like uncharacterized protein